MFTQRDVLVKHEQYQDLLREAQAERLKKEVAGENEQSKPLLHGFSGKALFSRVIRESLSWVGYRLLGRNQQPEVG